MEKVSYKTIKSYLAAVRHLHISSGLSIIGVFPRSHLLIRGIKHTQGDIMVKPCLPITPSILQSIKVSLASTPLDYDNRLYWAAMCLGSLVSSAVGSSLCRMVRHLILSVHLARGDVVINSGLCPAGISRNIKSSKTDPFQQGVILYLGQPGLTFARWPL